MQGISGAKAARYKEDGSGMTGDESGAIHTNYRAVYTKERAVHVQNEYGLGTSADLAAAGLVRLENRNGAAAIEGKNHNEAEDTDFSAVINSDLENSGTGNQRTAPLMLRSGQFSHLPCKWFIVPDSH